MAVKEEQERCQEQIKIAIQVFNLFNCNVISLMKHYFILIFGQLFPS